MTGKSWKHVFYSSLDSEFQKIFGYEWNIHGLYIPNLNTIKNYIFRSLTPIVALGANLICNKLPGLTPRQRTICQSQPDALAAVGQGTLIGERECQHQFRNRRWNCSDMAHPSSYLFGNHKKTGGGSKYVYLIITIFIY